MMNNLLLLGMGAGEFVIIIFLLLILSLPKIIFITELNKLLVKYQNAQFDSVVKSTWLLFIPIVSFFYVFSLSLKVDSVISGVLGKKYNRYYKISMYNLLMVVSYLWQINISPRYSYEKSGLIYSLLGMAILILFVWRIIDGFTLYFDIKRINKLTNTKSKDLSTSFVNINTEATNNKSNNQYSGGYDGGHNSSKSSDTELINPSIKKDGGYQNGNLYN